MYRTAYLLFAISLLFGITYGIYTPIMSIFAANEMGATYQDLGMIGMVTFLPYVMIPLVIGVMVERINSKYLLTIGFVMNALAMYLIHTATSIIQLMLYSPLSGIAYALIWPPSIHILSKNQKTRVKFMSIFTMCFVVGYMVGPLIGAILLEISGIDHRAVFLIMAYMASAGVVSLVLKYPHRRSKGAHVDLHLFKEVLKFPVLIIILLYSTVTFGLVLSIYPAFLHDNGFDDTTIMQLYAIFGVTRILAFVLAKKLSKHRKGVLLLSTSCVIVAMAISIAGTSFIEFAAVMLLLGFGFASIYPVALDIILAGSKKFTAGRLVGTYESIFGIGWTIGPIASGYIGYTLGTSNLYLILLAVGLSVLLLTLAYRNRMQTAMTVLEYDTKSKKSRSIFVKQTLKNHLGVISMSIGLVDKLLKNSTKETFAKSDTAGVFKTVNQTKININDMLSEGKDIVHPTLATEIHNILAKINEADSSSAGSGYPDYDNIQKMLSYCTDRLDRSMSDDAILK